MMNALKLYAPGDCRLERVPIPEIGDEDILIKVEACGICAGDIKTLHGGIRVWGTSEKDRYIEAPAIQGHEFVGRVVAFGSKVKGVEIGDRMVSEQIVPCGECRFCKEGNYRSMMAVSKLIPFSRGTCSVTSPDVVVRFRS